MKHRFHLLLAFAVMALAVTAGVRSQAQPAPELSPPGKEPMQPVEPPADLPRVHRGDPEQNLDRLFAALRAAPTEESAKYIERRIWATWAAQGGDTATLLMTRVRTATEGKDFDLAIKLLTAIIDIKPDYIEAWNRRATLYFLKRDYEGAMADLRVVLQREPRHFGAWAGVGMILKDVGDERRALTALRRAVELYPRMERVPDLIKRLTETVDGRDI
ncbi:MAG: tetratricopeptide repeat protein [Rhizobiales bacterium]|nr:tetratricopeptide repeat protein [Hyphomicrobiales bacterium]